MVRYRSFPFPSLPLLPLRADFHSIVHTTGQLLRILRDLDHEFGGYELQPQGDQRSERDLPGELSLVSLHDSRPFDPLLTSPSFSPVPLHRSSRRMLLVLDGKPTQRVRSKRFPLPLSRLRLADSVLRFVRPQIEMEVHDRHLRILYSHHVHDRR